MNIINLKNIDFKCYWKCKYLHVYEIFIANVICKIFSVVKLCVYTYIEINAYLYLQLNSFLTVICLYCKTFVLTNIGFLNKIFLVNDTPLPSLFSKIFVLFLRGLNLSAKFFLQIFNLGTRVNFGELSSQDKRILERGNTY